MVPDGGREFSAEPLVIPEIIKFPAEVDISNCEHVTNALRAAIQPGVPVVIADLSRTRFCDGAGIRCLLAAHDHAVACGVELRAVISSPAVWRLLVLLGGDTKLRVYPDMKSGLSGAPGAARPGQDDSESRAAAVFERSQEALRAASVVAQHVIATRENLRQRRSASDTEMLRTSEFARLFKRASTLPVIEQAKGILMFYERCTADEAFDMLRRASQRSNVPVREIAAEIVARTSS